MNSLDIIFIGILSKGGHNKINNQIISKKYNNDFINLNILYFLINLNMNQNIKGITSFSDIKQYEDFQYRFNYLQKLLINKSFIKDDIQNTFGETKTFKKYDQYGGQ